MPKGEVRHYGGWILCAWGLNPLSLFSEVA